MQPTGVARFLSHFGPKNQHMVVGNMLASTYCDLRPKFWQPPWVADFGAKKVYDAGENMIEWFVSSSGFH